MTALAIQVSLVMVTNVLQMTMKHVHPFVVIIHFVMDLTPAYVSLAMKWLTVNVLTLMNVVRSGPESHFDTCHFGCHNKLAMIKIVNV